MNHVEYLGNDVAVGESSDGKHIIIWNKTREDESVYIPKDLIGTIKDYIERLKKNENI